jgi:hypothetical protein
MEDFMDKAFISELGKYTLNRVIEFSEYYRNENILETSFENWNARDVIGHLNSWLKHNADKLEAAKSKHSFGEVNAKEYNKEAYEKNKTKSLNDIVYNAKVMFANYENILALYDEDELFGKEFSKIVSFALWYMDLFIHPIMHLLYQYMKKGDYDVFINVVESSKKYSNNEARKYSFGAFFGNSEEQTLFFSKLNEKIKKEPNGFIEEIIKLNKG